MAYCTYTDVQSEFLKLDLSGNTKVTEAEVTEFIVQADYYIDSKLGNKYIVPARSNWRIMLLSCISYMEIWQQGCIWIEVR